MLLQRSARLACASSVMLVVSACASGELDPGLSLASVAVENLSDLPACNAESDGEVRFVASEEALYACVTAEWRKVPTGAAGPQGANGRNGEDGHDALIITTPEPAGTNCANGGVRVDSGTDLNDDQILSPDEIKQASVFICNVTGVRVIPVPAGGICRNGGTRLDVGVDKDGNGEISDAEVTSSEYLCDALRFTKVSTGQGHSCAIASDSSLRCWGSNPSGAVGPNRGMNATTPHLVTGVTDVVDVAAGGNHTCAVLRDGTVRCWGFNGTGQLGNNTFTSSTSPVTVVQTDGAPLTGVTSVVAGLGHSCALVGDRVQCWGDGGGGQLGNNAFGGRSTANKVLAKSGSSIVELTGVTALYGGWYHSCALLNNGRARCWGSNAHGTLGNNSTRSSATAVFVVGPRGTEAMRGVKSLAPGSLHSCAVVGTEAFCWGKNDLGQLGNGTYNSRLLPAKVVAQSGTALRDVRAIATTAYSTCAVAGTARGAVCWGGDTYGLLGNGSTASGPTPTPVVALSDVESFSSSESNVCARLINGRLSCWGDNRSGQLGNGTVDQTSVPTEVWSNW